MNVYSLEKGQHKLTVYEENEEQPNNNDDSYLSSDKEVSINLPQGDTLANVFNLQETKREREEDEENKKQPNKKRALVHR